jgi:hypothetical protein
MLRISEDGPQWLIHYTSNYNVYYPLFAVWGRPFIRTAFWELAVFPSSGDSLKVKVTLRLTVSQSVSLGVEPLTRYLFVWQLRSCFCWELSLTRGRVCLLYMLLALTSAVFLGSESLGTHDHILLSQIWDFHFRRLLRLAGSWWRYSTSRPELNSVILLYSVSVSTEMFVDHSYPRKRVP